MFLYKEEIVKRGDHFSLLENEDVLEVRCSKNLSTLTNQFLFTKVRYWDPADLEENEYIRTIRVKNLDIFKKIKEDSPLSKILINPQVFEGLGVFESFLVPGKVLVCFDIFKSLKEVRFLSFHEDGCLHHFYKDFSFRKANEKELNKKLNFIEKEKHKVPF